MGGFFDAPAKQTELEASEKLISEPGFWDDQESAQKVVQQRSRIEKALARQNGFETGVSDAEVLFEFAAEDPEVDLVDDYWLSFVLSHYLGVRLIKIKADHALRVTPSADNKDVAMFHNPEVHNERVRFYVRHMRAGWPRPQP